MRPHRVLPALALALVALGCGGHATQVVRLSPERQALPASARVEVYLDPDVAPAIDEIALIETHADSTDLTLREPLARATDLAEREARAVGADVLILRGVRREEIVREIHADSRIRVVCLHYRWVAGRRPVVAIE